MPIVIKLHESYKQWHGFLGALPRLTRYTLGVKIDNLFTESLELALLAGYAARPKKPDIIDRLSSKIDCLKFFLKVLWELKGIDTKKYTALSRTLEEIGKMVGGWMKSIRNVS